MARLYSKGTTYRRRRVLTRSMLERLSNDPERFLTLPEAASDSTEAYLNRLAEACGKGDQPKLIQLWRNWEVVMGDFISSICVPMGHREKRLLVAAEDNMAMNELIFMKDEIMERANVFLDEPFFEEVQVQACFGRRPLSAAETFAPAPLPPVYTAPAANLTGEALSSMNPESAIARCYRAFVEARRSRR